MKTWIYNPFEYIAGYKALFIGLAVMLLSTFLGSLNGSHFDGAIDMHIGTHTASFFYYIETFISWFITALIFYLIGIVLSKSSVRPVDVLGTMAFARIPLILTLIAGFFPLTEQLKGLNPADPQETAQKIISILPTLLLISAPIVASLIWTITLMFNAYKISCNLKGARLISSFIIGLIAAEILSKMAIYAAYKHLFNLPVTIPGIK
jgi:hypothetical protein